MKTLKYKILTIIALTLLASCNQKDDDTSIQEVNSNDITVVELSKTNNFQGDELGIYGMEFTGLNDFTLRNKITKYRYSEGIKDYLNSYALTKEVTDLNTFNKVAFAGLSFEKTNEMMEPQFLKAYRAKKGVGIKEKVQEVSSAMFGKEQTFSLKTSNYEIKESQYIPGRIASLMIEKYLKGAVSLKRMERLVIEKSLEDEYLKPYSGKPFKINDK